MDKQGKYAIWYPERKLWLANDRCRWGRKYKGFLEYEGEMEISNKQRDSLLTLLAVRRAKQRG